MASPITALALKSCVLKALQVGSSLLSTDAMLELQHQVLQDISIQLGISQAPFVEPLPPPPLTQDSEDIDVICHLADELDQVFFPTTFKSLCAALAALGTANYHYLQDQLHPTEISPAPFPVNIPPTPSSHSGSLFVPFEDIPPPPLLWCQSGYDRCCW